ncbi:MAG: 2-isopropylmalate synthase [Thermoleophilia bacterium]|nr:2-isopropylmalate synthase [Thermoleophilia bacterium]
MSDANGYGREQALLYDWNLVSDVPAPQHRVELNDETLRDGLQSPSARHPSLERRIELLHHMERLRIDAANIGYAGAGHQALADVIALAAEIRQAGLSIWPNCAGRTAPADIEPIAAAQHASGVRIAAHLFLGSSPLRQYAEGWDLDFLLRTTEAAVGLARSLDLDVMFVTEDTTRARAEDLRALYTTAIEAGATRICLADTVGHATPWGVRNLVRFVRGVVADSGEDVRIDWHGHRDRGLDVINSLVALAEGVDRIHACGLGIGERSGNTPLDVLLVNLKLLGWIDRDLTSLPGYCRAVADALEIPIPCNYPVVGGDAFRTSTGVHASAILKALRRGDTWLADRVYSSVPASDCGLEQVITIGPMSGQANVVAWLDARRLPYDGPTVERILAAAKASNHVLEEREVMGILAAASAA